MSEAGAPEYPSGLWVYRGRAIRVIDGDSVVCLVDAGFGVHVTRGNEGAHLRLLGVDTPERNEPGWEESRSFTTAWLDEAATSDQAWPLRLVTEKTDNFGRYLAWVFRTVDRRCLNEDLFAAGLAVKRVR